VPETVISVVAGSGVAGAVLILVVLGWLVPRPQVGDLKEQVRELKAAVAAERSRADAAVEAAQTTNLLLAGLRREVAR